MSKLEIIKNQVNNAEELARKIWLAGLGAYGKSYDGAKGQVESLSSTATKLFDELVEKGEVLEGQAKGKIKENTNIESRVAEVRSKLGLDKQSNEEQIAELSAKIDALTTAVAKLSTEK